MGTWTRQSGFPVVNVVKVSNTEYKLTQKRFLSNAENEQSQPDDSEFKYRWTIPITYTTSNAPTTVHRQFFDYRDLEGNMSKTF